jgi:hypothetical protein
MARSRLRGAGRFRRTLKALPDAVSQEIVVELNVTGRTVRSLMQAKAPKKSGRLAAAITYRVLPKSLRMQVGLIGSQKERNDLFYGRIQDLGRKAQVVQARRRVGTFADPQNRGAPRSILKTYTMRVSAMAPKRFITGRYADMRSALNTNLRGIWTRALSAAAAGGGDE